MKKLDTEVKQQLRDNVDRGTVRALIALCEELIKGMAQDMLNLSVSGDESEKRLVRLALKLEGAKQLSNLLKDNLLKLASPEDEEEA